MGPKILIPEHHPAALRVQVAGDLWDTARFVDSVRLPYIAPSLGGVETLIEQPTVISYWDQACPSLMLRRPPASILRDDCHDRVLGCLGARSEACAPSDISDCAMEVWVVSVQSMFVRGDKQVSK